VGVARPEERLLDRRRRLAVRHDAEHQGAAGLDGDEAEAEDPARIREASDNSMLTVSTEV
jgi:hypothetical protein